MAQNNIAKVPVVETSNFLNKTGDYKKQCEEVAQALHTYGCVIIRDPRVNQQDNDNFLDMFEKYFVSRGEMLYKGEKVPEALPEWGYQSGATPPYKERARLHESVVKQFTAENAAYTPQPPPYDAKWRYFYRIGEKPANRSTEFDPPKVIPSDFPNFESTCERWGNLMLDGCMTVAKMAAIGMELPEESFTERMQGGDHLLAPTGSDLVKNDKGAVFAGFHYDLNFLTIHGKSRYPGLFVWLRTGEKIPVAVPDGCLLLQAGKQFEWMTGGYVTCGFHEVIYTDAVKEKVQQTLEKGGIPWRISSTLFSHIRFDAILEPVGKFANEESVAKFPKTKALDQVLEEVKSIELKKD
ncbi:hypothetical protein ABPG74_014244 [Tetrahymena malaccensis]